MRQFALLLLILWFSRIPALTALPLHNDEGLHLTRAVEVWNLHPFWEIRDGKIINHWVIAAFYPQHDPVFVGRIATIFVSLIGFAAGYALIKRQFGGCAALLAGALWITSPYLFFFERLALSDAEAGALVVLTLWASWRLAERGTIRSALLAGFALALATLFKFTAVPFAFSVALIVLLRACYPLRRRIVLLLIAAGAVVACFAIPMGYLLLRGSDLFSIALGWIGGGSGAANQGIGANLAMLGSALFDFGYPFWSLTMLVGLAMLMLSRRHKHAWLLPLAVGVPLASIVVLGREVLPRHYVIALPALLLLGGAGIGAPIEAMVKAAGKSTRDRYSVYSLPAYISIMLTVGFVPFALHAYTAPDQLRVPEAIWTQYFSQHSSGYGLREAVQAFPQTISDRSAPIIASMTADSCRRANFYAVGGLELECVDAPGLVQIKQALDDHAEVYVLVEDVTGAHFPLDADPLNADAELIATYPRPGVDGQPVTLWKLTSRPSEPPSS